jgi:hypothetical protein
MAPFYGPGRQEVLAMLRSWFPRRSVPITLGRGAPAAVIDEVDGVWTLRPLVLDHAAVRVAAEETACARQMCVRAGP